MGLIYSISIYFTSKIRKLARSEIESSTPPPSEVKLSNDPFNPSEFQKKALD
jgi:hypothetical protein